MTVIAGLVYNGKVYMAGDRGMSDETIIKSMIQPKVKRVGSMVIGYSDTIGTGQLAQVIEYPPLPQSGLDIYMRTDFIRTLKDACDYYSPGLDIHDAEKASADLLVAVSGKLFEVNTQDWSATEHDTVAVGSGSYYALGSLYSTRDWVDPKARLREALKAAIFYAPGCRGPIDIVVL